MKNKWAAAIGLGLSIIATSTIAGSNQLATLSDEFSTADSIKQWKIYNREHLKTFEVQDGKLVLEPNAKVSRIAWYMDDTGPLVYKQINGNFLAEIQLEVSSMKEPDRAPYGSFNSAGFVIRNPASTYKDQNWIMYNFGNQDFGFGREAKTTSDSESYLSIASAPSKFNSGKLRICRIDSTFYLYHKMENEKSWISEEASEEFVRNDLPEIVDVGMIINASGTPKETRAEFDYIRFSDVGSKADCTK